MPDSALLCCKKQRLYKKTELNRLANYKKNKVLFFIVTWLDYCFCNGWIEGPLTGRAVNNNSCHEAKI
jgi:uncharacterized protein YqiB (DUF1249 family)